MEQTQAPIPVPADSGAVARPPTQYSWIKDKKILYAHNDNTNLSTKGLVNSIANKNVNHRKCTANHSNVASHGCKPSGRHRAGYPSAEDNVCIVGEQNLDKTNEHHGQNTTRVGFYELKKTIGRGNFSTVKLAQHCKTAHFVAIKVVRILDLSKENLIKVKREIAVLKRLSRHDHIVRLYQVIKSSKYYMLVTEYCPNGELFDYLVEKGKLSERQSCDFFLQILSAIEYLHDHNVVHRDLKAENLLLTDNFKTVKLADFGFANYFKNDTLLSTWCGSPPYAAPELFKGVEYVGPPVDIWSMGVILYVLVCGALPFDGHNLVYLKSRVLSGKFRIPFFMSTECEGLIRGMLRLDPERRFSVRQIRSHSWTQKYQAILRAESDRECFSAEMSQNLNLGRCRPTLKSTIDNKASSIERSEDTRRADVNNNSNDSSARGLSLDLVEEDQPTANSDASMMCLTNGSGGMVSRLSQNMAPKFSKIRNFVNTDMANAVSNMSIDSNNSSMSVSQSNDASAPGTTDRSTSVASGHNVSGRSDTDTSSTLYPEVYQQMSIDNRIIDFMVSNLKVAKNPTKIMDSIMRQKYDDLHAIYRLIKDEPEILNSDATFKIPPLPLINLNGSGVKPPRPSITTGVVQSPPVCNQAGQRPQLDLERRQSINESSEHIISTTLHIPSLETTNLGHNLLDTSQAINLVTHTQSELQAQKYNQAFEHRRSEDQSYAPPALVLTRPTDNRTNNQQQTGGSANETSNIDCINRSFLPSVTTKAPARHSFDSTMHDLAFVSNSLGGTNFDIKKFPQDDNDNNFQGDTSLKYRDSTLAKLSDESNTDSGIYQQNPLDLSRGSKDPVSGNDASCTHINDRLDIVYMPNAQRSNSTTSALTIFNTITVNCNHQTNSNNININAPRSTTTSPRNSFLVANPAPATSNNNMLPLCTISPSTLSLTGGGPGHLPNRRKRHSLETEARHCHNPHHHHQNGHPSPKCRHMLNGPHELSTRAQQARCSSVAAAATGTTAKNSEHFLKCRLHLGSQLKDFAQNLSHKMVKRPDSGIASPTSYTPGQRQAQLPIEMDVNCDQIQPDCASTSPQVNSNLFGTPLR